MWESADIMRRIEADFSGDAAPPLLPAAGTAERARAEAMLEASGALGKAGFQMALAARNESLAEAERAALRASFEAVLSDLDAQIAAGGGPFMLGAERLNRTLALALALTLTLTLTLTPTLTLALALTLTLTLTRTTTTSACAR